MISCPTCDEAAIPIGVQPNKNIALFWICEHCEESWHYWEPGDAGYDDAQTFVKKLHQWEEA